MRNLGCLFVFVLFCWVFLVSSSFINTTLAGRPLTVLPGASVSAPSPSAPAAAHIFLQCEISPPPLPVRGPGLRSGRCRRWGLFALDL